MSILTTQESTAAAPPRPQGRRLKLAHVQLLPLLSGVQRVTLEEFRRLSADDWELSLICKEQGPLTEAAGELGVRCFVVPELERPISPVRDVIALSKLRRLMRRERFDVVHTHSSKTGCLGRLAATMARIPVVVHTVHGFAFPAAESRVQRTTYRLMEWIAGKACHKVICLNSADAEICSRDLAVPESRVQVIPNGIDTEAITPPGADGKRANKQRLFGMDPATVCVAMIGRLWDQKNPQLFVRGIARAVEGGLENSHFFFVGDGPLDGELREMVRNAGLESRVTFLGWRNDIESLLGAFDLIVLPSRWEGMPLTLLEASAAGIPAIATDIPGNNHVVEHEVTGLLFPQEDAARLAQALTRLCQEDDLRSQFGRAARLRSERHFDIVQRTQEIAELYRSLYASSAGR